jgi:uncharacterized membrane protein YbhN (UPF0104 family)
VTAALVAYVVRFLLGQRDELAQRFSGTVWHAALLGLGILGTWTVNSLQTLLPLRELGVRIGFWENLMLTVATIFGNYLPMRAGSLLRLEYVRAVHGVGYFRFGGLLGARSLILLGVAAAAGLSGVVAMRLVGQDPRPEAFVIFAGILGLCAVPFVVPVERLLTGRGAAMKAIRQLGESVALVRQNRRILAWYVGLVVLQLMFLAARLAVSFDAIERHPPAWVYCFLSPIATILSFINLTPGNIGLREWLVGLLSAAVGVDYADGIVAASIDRGVLIAMTLVAGGPALALVVSRMTRRRAHEPSA